MAARLALVGATGAAARIRAPDDEVRPASAKRRFFLAHRVLPKCRGGKSSSGTSTAQRQCACEGTPSSSSGSTDDYGKPPLPAAQEGLSLRKRLGLLLDSPKSSWSAMGVMCLMIVVIITSVLNFFIATIPSLKGGREVHIIETCCSVFFTIEVLLRTFVATQNPKRMMLFDLGYWIDVLCVVPFYVELVASSLRNGPVTQLPTWLRVLQLLRLLRIIKLFRHYSAWRVILLALQNSWRALMVPGFAMYMTILILAGALYLAEESTLTEEQMLNEEGFKDAFDAMWVVFWLVATLGFDGYMGADSPAHKLVIAAAIVSGLIFTTMPITIIGEAFRSAWERKEVLEAQMKIQEMLVERGQTLNELDQVFNQLDSSGDGTLDWGEFKEAMKLLGIKVPVSKMRSLFAMFDEDETGEIDYPEFCRLLFPNLDSIPAAAGDGADEAGASTDIPPPRKVYGELPPPSKNAFRKVQTMQALQSGGANAFAAASTLALAAAKSNAVEGEGDGCAESVPRTEQVSSPPASNPFAKALLSRAREPKAESDEATEVTSHVERTRCTALTHINESQPALSPGRTRCTALTHINESQPTLAPDPFPNVD